MRGCFLLFSACFAAQAHDIVTTSITWNREISRIVNQHCASCHRPGGMAFSLMTYGEARPWAVAIKEEILRRRMPPWGAVKGFGEFRNDQALTPEEMERIVSWTDGGVPEGDAKDLPPPLKRSETAPLPNLRSALIVGGEFALTRPFRLNGLWAQRVPENSSIQITAQLPDGAIVPLLWLLDYKARFDHPFLFATPLDLPAHTVIRGVPSGARIALLPSAPRR